MLYRIKNDSACGHVCYAKQPSLASTGGTAIRANIETAVLMHCCPLFPTFISISLTPSPHTHSQMSPTLPEDVNAFSKMFPILTFVFAFASRLLVYHSYLLPIITLRKYIVGKNKINRRRFRKPAILVSRIYFATTFTLFLSHKSLVTWKFYPQITIPYIIYSVTLLLCIYIHTHTEFSTFSIFVIKGISILN